MIKNRFLFSILLFLQLFTTTLSATIPIDQALMVSASVKNNQIQLHWDIAPDYYILADKFRFTTESLGLEFGTAIYPPPQQISDPFFGTLNVYQQSLDIQIPISKNELKTKVFTFFVRLQGCSDKEGCFPVHQQSLLLALDQSADQPTPIKTPVEMPIFQGSSATEPEPTKAAEEIPNLMDSFDFGETDDQILPVEQAYQFEAAFNQEGKLNLNWRIADGTYLYADKIKFEIQGEKISFADFDLPKADIKKNTIRPDGEMGDIAVYKHQLDLNIPLIFQQKNIDKMTLNVSYQGCADRGICYPPIKQQIVLEIPEQAKAFKLTTTNQPKLIKSTPINEQDKILSMLQNQNWFWGLLVLYGVGVLLAFTPCVFPMIPILSGIIAGYGNQITTKKAFYLSSIYVLFMALTYAGVGVLAGLFGAKFNLQAAFQDPIILSLFALLFVVLAFAMFGFYQLQLPSAWQSKLNNLSNQQQGGGFIGVAIMGVLSALIVGPCVTAPLVAVLIYIAQSKDGLYGGLALFSLGLGMGTPLIMLGTSAGTLLPKAGAWMDAIKAIFGVMLLALAISMLERFADPSVILLLWGLLFIACAIYLGALEPLKENGSNWSKLWKACGVILLIYGTLMLIGVAAGGKDSLQPLKNIIQISSTSGATIEVNKKTQFKRIKTIDDLNNEIKIANAKGQNVLLDFYADWCVYCKELEKYTFTNSKVKQAFIDKNIVLLQADVTDMDDKDKALLDYLQIPNPPALVFYGQDGLEKKSSRLFGFLKPEPFIEYLNRVF